MKQLFVILAAFSILSCGGKNRVDAEPSEKVTFPGFTTDFTNASVPLEEIISGGPGKDGIPAIDTPVFESVRESDKTVENREPVIVLSLNTETKIYPLRILVWHEIVNDKIGNIPVAVTYCPLCNTGVVFKSSINEKDLDFGTTGRLRFSNLIMYDRQSETWWQQATGKGIAGPYAGRNLQMLPSLFLSWKDAKRRYPNALVLSEKTGWNRPYGTNPYRGYDTSTPFLYTGSPPVATTEQLSLLDRVVLVSYEGETRLVSYKQLRKERFVQFRLKDRSIVVFWTSGTASALDTSIIKQGRDVGIANAFYAYSGNQKLTFVLDEGGFIDKETESSWDISGFSTKGPLAGKHLNPVAAIQHFWFSAAAFSRENRAIQDFGP